MTGVLITPSSGDTQVTEAGQLDTYKIQLTNAPLTPVTITIKTDRQTLIAKPNQTLRRRLEIMPIGDSITYGVINSFNNTQSGGYRTYLWQRLKRDGYAVDFAGSQHNGPSSIDRDHEGYRGKTIDGIANTIAGHIAKERPDIVLLLAGTNDILQNRALVQAPQRLSRLIDQIREQANATVLVGTLPPNTRSQGNAQRVQAFNRAILRRIKHNQQHQSVQFVDLYHALSNRDLADRTHPTAQGYQKMADTWYDSLLGVLNSPANMFLSQTQTFTFTPQNWQTAQTVTVVARDDQQREGIHQSLLLHQTHSVDARYDGLEATLPVTVVDDDPGIVLIPVNESQLPLQEGETANYQVQLSRKPTAQTIVHLSADPHLQLSRSKLSFTPARWQRSQMITVKAMEDPKLDDLHQGRIRYTIQSQDFHYQGLGKKQIVLAITEWNSSDQLTVGFDSLLKSNIAVCRSVEYRGCRGCAPCVGVEPPHPVPHTSENRYRTLKRTSPIVIWYHADDHLLDFGPSSQRMHLQNRTSMIDSTGLLTEGPAGSSEQITVQNYRSLDHAAVGVIGSDIELTSVYI